MSQEVLAIDLDDVVSSQTEVLMRFSNEQYGTSLTAADFQVPGDYWGYYEKILHVDPEEGARRFKDFLDQNLIFTQVISRETLGALKRLKNQFRLEIVTSRGAVYEQQTVAWLEEHASETFDGVHFVELWDKNDQKATKALICKEIGAGYLLDDNVDHCNLAQEAGVQAMLFGTYGWNIGKTLVPGIVRVQNWDEVEKYLGSR